MNQLKTLFVLIMVPVFIALLYTNCGGPSENLQTAATPVQTAEAP